MNDRSKKDEDNRRRSGGARQGGHHGQCIKPDWIPAGRAGRIEGRADYVVSPDGGTLTLSATWRGGVAQVSVFTRD